MKKLKIFLPVIVIAMTILACAAPAISATKDLISNSRTGHPGPTGWASTDQPVQVPAVVSSSQELLVNLYDKVSPGVVAIQVIHCCR